MRTTLGNLQGLRGIACLLVLGIHTAGWEANFGIAREFLRPFLWFGYAGVDLFFVVSGFIIAFTQADSFGKPSALPRYLFRRAWRIYPAFWAIMLIAVPLTDYVMAPFPGAPWFAWLTLTPDAFPNYYLPPAWTMTYEICFYVAFAILLLMPRRIAPFALLSWAAVVGWAESAKTDDSFYAGTFATTFTSPLILEFLLGCCVAFVVRRGISKWGRTAIAVGIAWAGWGIVLCHPGGEPYALCTKVMPRVLVFGPAAALLVYGAIAAKIRERATEARVPLVENVPLARALHASCKVGQEIPASLYASVAQVLAFVMSLQKRGAAAGTHRQPGGQRTA